MTFNEYQDCQRGDKLYFARIMPKFGYYEVHDVVMVNKYDDHCSVCETKTKQSFLFNVKEDRIRPLFVDRDEALQYLKDEKKNNKDVKVYATSEERGDKT